MRRTLLQSIGLPLALVILATSHAGAAEPSRADLERDFRDVVRPFIETHCFACHAQDKSKGSLDLRKFPTVESVAKDFPPWEAVLEQLKSEEMPPAQAKKQPTRDKRQQVIAWIEGFRKSESQRNAGDPGLVLARRLSNAEYDLTVRDLTGVDIRPAREFPVDPANESGFDNTGESLVMSPALVKKYLAANQNIADHLLLLPDGFTFAPYPVLTDTDRDKYCVRRIVDFYQRQPTNLADYFYAAWHYHHRAKLGRPKATLADCANTARVSPKYLATIWATLSESSEELGPIAAVQALWRDLPAPDDKTPDDVRRDCEKMRDFVVQLRQKVQVKVENLTVREMNRGAQALVLWKDRQMATNRRTYGGGALKLEDSYASYGTAVSKAMKVPTTEKERERCEAAFKRFCSVFPDAFYISERGRVFLDPREDRLNTGRLLSAGFHNQMGYFRDDQPLCELILDDTAKKALDTLWHEFDFASNVPFRMHSGLIWFERSESQFLAGKEFDFARAEDKDVTAPEKFKKFVEVYLEKTKKNTSNETIIKAVQDHFAISEANIRRVEKARKEAEASHIKALQDFAQRAYRRRLTTKERDEIADFYAVVRKEEKLGHEDAVRDSLISILMSPHFCFRVDLPLTPAKEPPGKMQPLSDEALASRLSYFLWSSMPDKELSDCATRGTLHRPEVLLAQTRRMLQDDRVRGLAMQFGGNWLDFRRFDEHNAVDRTRFPAFDNDLRAAMYEEPLRFFVDLVQRDRSVLQFLDAKHTFVNAPLAKHYGMPAPASEWVRIDDADKYERGGLLSMSVFMTKNSPGLRTSPVKRGYWVVTRLLGERIPAPPPNVPELPADEKKLGKLTLRETLVQHRQDKNCAVCHARFDSFGLAFEGFGPIGEGRTKDLADNPVDTRVSFPGGSEGKGVQGLRDYLREKRQQDFLDNLCRKLLAYGLGRTIQLSDETTLAEMRTQLARKEHRFSTLIEIIVTSPQFLNKRGSRDAVKE